MKCEKYQDLVAEYQEGSLPPGMKEDVEKHLQECPSCRSVFTQHMHISKSITDLLGRTTASLVLTPAVQKEIALSAMALQQSAPRDVMVKLLKELTFREIVGKVIHGLKQPRDSADFRFAVFYLMRLLAPAGSILLHVVAVIFLVRFAVGGGTEAGPPVEAVIMETRAEELDQPAEEIEREIKQEIEQLPEPVDVPEHEVKNNYKYSATEEISYIDNPGQGRGLGTGTGTGVGDGDAAGFQISGAKSPLMMKGLYGNRGSGGRGKALSKYGGGGATEGAVLRALRWLKKYQKSDGSWSGDCAGAVPAVAGEHYGMTGADHALTGLALLCYLAHGETPASEEFGPTVEKAIKWIVASQGANGKFPAGAGDIGYGEIIATYALCEAYGMTKVPALLDPASKAVDFIIKGQHTTGGWDYHCNPASKRDDTSVTAWCAQALKAAKMAGVTHPELETAIRNAVKGQTQNFVAGTGSFGYDNNSKGSIPALTCAAVLSMQLLGAAKEPECRQGLLYMDKWTCDWDNPLPRNPFYYWYYATQAKFHAGGEAWNSWNKQLSVQIPKNQKIVKGGGEDGKDIGFWDSACPEEYCQSLVYNTTFCCLMLEVYYRYLPTYKQAEEVKVDDDSSTSTDINIEIK